MRGKNNGFDGAVVWRDFRGELQITLSESKAWSKTTGSAGPADMTAFGLGRGGSSIFEANVNTLLEHMTQSSQGLTKDEILKLIAKVRAKDFDVIFHGLPETRFAISALEGAFQNLAKRGIAFRNIPM